jgi:4-alpha-glucanotransferase
VLIAMIEDVFGIPERQNHPGTLDEWPNWSLALPPLEELMARPMAARLAAILSRRAAPG